jgi:hypothetical protein
LHRPAVFYDLLGTLVLRSATGYEPGPAAEMLYGTMPDTASYFNQPDNRVEPRWVLEEAGLIDLLDPQLMIVPSDLPCPLPDRRAFAVAAAIAETPIDQCMFVSARLSLMQRCCRLWDAGGQFERVRLFDSCW